MTRRRNPNKKYRGAARLRFGAKTVVTLAALAIVFSSCLRSDILPWWRSKPRIDASKPQLVYEVRRVVDGDTLLLANGDRVRLIGVDTPESVAPGQQVEWLGPEASQFTTRLIEGQKVRLGFDKERVDRYGRVLAYVYVDGILLNELLIREGFSKAQMQYPYSSAMKRLFRDAESDAQRRRKGLWAAPSGSKRFYSQSEKRNLLHTQH